MLMYSVDLELGRAEGGWLVCIPSHPGILSFLTIWQLQYFFFNWRLISLQYCIGFAIHQHESATGVHTFPILNPPPHFPPRTIPLGHPSAPAPSILYPASNLDW